nr:immunoglobulin heavy chain junction region [Macaca mulatta]
CVTVANGSNVYW